jgi:hypothetical protein
MSGGNSCGEHTLEELADMAATDPVQEAARLQREREMVERERARDLFRQAGRPIPAWAREPGQ